MSAIRKPGNGFNEVQEAQRGHVRVQPCAKTLGRVYARIIVRNCSCNGHHRVASPAKSPAKGTGGRRTRGKTVSCSCQRNSDEANCLPGDRESSAGVL